MANWLLVSLAIITFFNRYVFFARAVRYSPGPSVRRFLSYSSFAVLTAIWVPILFEFHPEGSLSFAGYDYLLGAVLAAVLTVARVPSIWVVLLSTGVFFALRFY